MSKNILLLAADAVYLACEKDVADHISKLLRDSHKEITQLRADLKARDEEVERLDKGWQSANETHLVDILEAADRIIKAEASLAVVVAILESALEHQVANRHEGSNLKKFYLCYTYGSGTFPEWVIKAEQALKEIKEG